MKKHEIFVYGTLLKGQPNNSLLSNSVFLGQTYTESKFTLVDLGYFPGLLDKGSTSVYGEVYEITDETFEKLDQLEGYPTLYTRKLINTAAGNDIWVYIYNKYRTTHVIIENGNWLEYTKSQQNFC